MTQRLLDKKIHELLTLCLEISQGNKYNAWFGFSGHVNLIDIRIAPKDNYSNVIYDNSFYIDSQLFNRDKLLQAITSLEDYLEESEKEELKLN
jgi:hypothetical protein